MDKIIWEVKLKCKQNYYNYEQKTKWVWLQSLDLVKYKNNELVVQLQCTADHCCEASVNSPDYDRWTPYHLPPPPYMQKHTAKQ